MGLVVDGGVDAKSTFQNISSIHMYSLEPTVLQDLNVLTDVSREMLATYAHEDPLEYGNEWGMIQNKNVKVYLSGSRIFFMGHPKLISFLQRRTGARPPPPPTSTGPSTTTSSKATIPAKRSLQDDAPAQSKPEGSKPEPASNTNQQPPKENNQQQSKPTVKTAPAKKEKSNLFSSFAKAKPKQKKEETAAPESGAESVSISCSYLHLVGSSHDTQAEPSGAEDGLSTQHGHFLFMLVIADLL